MLLFRSWMRKPALQPYVCFLSLHCLCHLLLRTTILCDVCLCWSLKTKEAWDCPVCRNKSYLTYICIFICERILTRVRRWHTEWKQTFFCPATIANYWIQQTLISFIHMFNFGIFSVLHEYFYTVSFCWVLMTLTSL